MPPKPHISHSYPPALHEYIPLYCNSSAKIWKHSYMKEFMVEKCLICRNEVQINQIMLNYQVRLRHDYFLSTKYIVWQQGYRKCHIFFQKYVTNLHKITDLPFRDSLIFLHTGLKGFKALFDMFGYFEISEKMFFITQQRKVKIWVDQNIEALQPVKTNKKGSESDMINQIICMIYHNTEICEQSKYFFKLFCKGYDKFDEALKQLQKQCVQQKIEIQQTLQSFQHEFQDNINKFLDLFWNSRVEKCQQPHRQRDNNRADNSGIASDKDIKYFLHKESEKQNKIHHNINPQSANTIYIGRKPMLSPLNTNQSILCDLQLKDQIKNLSQKREHQFINTQNFDEGQMSKNVEFWKKDKYNSENIQQQYHNECKSEKLPQTYSKKIDQQIWNDLLKLKAKKLKNSNHKNGIL